jgi:hypothetical protein
MMMEKFRSEFIEPDLLTECKFREVTENMTTFTDTYPDNKPDTLTCDKCGRPLEEDEGWPWFSQGIPYLLCDDCWERMNNEIVDEDWYRD